MRIYKKKLALSALVGHFRWFPGGGGWSQNQSVRGWDSAHLKQWFDEPDTILLLSFWSLLQPYFGRFFMRNHTRPDLRFPIQQLNPATINTMHGFCLCRFLKRLCYKSLHGACVRHISCSILKREELLVLLHTPSTPPDTFGSGCMKQLCSYAPAP